LTLADLSDKMQPR